MAISENNLASWEDIKTLFTNLNTARSKWSFSTVSDYGGSQGGEINTTPLSTLKTKINEMSSNKYLRTVAVLSDNIPNVNELIEPLSFTRASSVISNIQSACAHDSTFRSSCNGFSDKGCVGFNSSRNGFTFNSSCNIHTNNTSDNGFTFNSTWCTSFRSSDNGFGFNSSRNGFGISNARCRSFLF